MIKVISIVFVVFGISVGFPQPVLAQATVTLTIDDGSAAEAGQDSGSFTVTRTGSTASSLSVWVTVGGTATNGADYSVPNLSGRGGSNYSISIPGGQTSRTLILTPLLDNLSEGTETFTVELRAPGDGGNDYTIGAPSSGQIDITDDVAEVTLTLDDGDASEAGPQPGSFTVTRNGSGNTAAALSVWVTVGGTATNGADYSVPNLSGRGSSNYSISIPGGQTSRTLILTPITDQVIEGDETFTVALRVAGDAGNDYTIGAPSEGVITIKDFVQIIFKDSFELP